MQKFRRAMLILAVAATASCGGDEGGGGSPASPSTVATLTGSWKATRAEFVSASNSGLRVEVCAMGTTLMLTLESGGTYTQKITDPGQAGQTTTGTWSASKEVLTLKPTGMSGETQFDMTLNGATLTLSNGHVLFDVNGDGTNEEALAYLTLARQ
jgi:hypothetical protein